jgi:hypothetical protein
MPSEYTPPFDGCKAILGFEKLNQSANFDKMPVKGMMWNTAAIAAALVLWP